MAELTKALCRRVLRQEFGLTGERLILMDDDKQSATAYAGKRLEIRFRIVPDLEQLTVAVTVMPTDVPACQAHSSVSPNALTIFYDIIDMALLD